MNLFQVLQLHSIEFFFFAGSIAAQTETMQLGCQYRHGLGHVFYHLLDYLFSASEQ